MAILSVSQAAAKKGITRGRIHQYISGGRLRATMVGTQYVIDEKDLDALEVKKTGRPPKPAAGTPARSRPPRRHDEKRPGRSSGRGAA